jgi:Holliday junction resolvasome RuvABC endonuclease subunit
VVEGIVMRGVGFCFQKGKIRASILEATSNGSVTYVDKKLISIDPELRLPELVDRYLMNFRGIIDQFQPDLVATKLTYEIETIDSAISQGMSVAMLAFACHENKKPLSYYTLRALRSGAQFGLGKSKKPIDCVDQTFGVHPPYWDEAQKTSLLVVWRALLENN